MAHSRRNVSRVELKFCDGVIIGNLASQLTKDDREPHANRDDDLESFGHILLWTALHHCEHQFFNDSTAADYMDIYLDTRYYNEKWARTRQFQIGFKGKLELEQ